jgi:hypothetical protein
MPTVQKLIMESPKARLDAAAHRLRAILGQSAAETVGAFFRSEAVPGPDWTVLPQLSDWETLRCSQKNIGDKVDMICNLSVAKADWYRLFTDGESDDVKADALCELANCVCGSVLADPEFSDEMGYLTPCVPSEGFCKAPAVSRTLRGSVLLKGAAIHFAFSILDSVSAARFNAAA